MMFRWGKRQVKNSGAWQFLQALWNRVSVPTTTITEFYTTYQLPTEWEFTHELATEWETVHILPTEWEFTHEIVTEWEI